jgi:hypothetical protein
VPDATRVGRGGPEPEADEEGFKAAARKFDPDLTEGNQPRAALGLGSNRIYAD